MKCHLPLAVLALLTTWIANAQVVTRTVFTKTATVTAANTVTTTSTRTTTLTTFQAVCTPSLLAHRDAEASSSDAEHEIAAFDHLEPRAASTTTISRIKTTTKTPTRTITAVSTATSTSCTSNCQIFALRLSSAQKPLLNNKFLIVGDTGTNDRISTYSPRIEAGTRFNVLKPVTDGLNGTLFAYLTPQEVGSIPAGSSASPVIFDRKIPGGRDALVCTIFTGGLTCGTGKADRFVVVGKTVWLVGSSGAPVDAVDVKLVPYCFSGI